MPLIYQAFWSYVLMDNIRCLIADMSQITLADIVHHLAEDSPSIDIVNRIDSIKNIHQLIQNYTADVVILGVESDSISREHTEILDAFPGLVMVGIVGNGRRAIVIVDDVGPNELTDLIHT